MQIKKIVTYFYFIKSGRAAYELIISSMTTTTEISSSPFSKHEGRAESQHILPQHKYNYNNFNMLFKNTKFIYIYSHPVAFLTVGKYQQKHTKIKLYYNGAEVYNS